jgi:signal transduction histidine kinase
MFDQHTPRTSHASLLRRYRNRLCRLAERDRADLAALAADRAAQAAEEAAVAMGQAQAVSRAKSRFLAHMSHELRTPLNAIIGFSDMIRLGLERLPGTAKLQEYAEDINGAGLHLLGVTNDVLDLAKIEAGKFELDEEPVNIAETVAACVTMLEVRIERKSLVYRQEIAPSLPAIKADRRKFKQVLINLLSNAVKFTPDGGRITLRAELEADSTIMLRVVDTGVGMAPEEIPNALIPFVQIDGRTDTKHEGTGLGLPLTKALVELHGGTIEIESAPSAGTTVIVRLPATRLLGDGATGRSDPGTRDGQTRHRLDAQHEAATDAHR